MVRLVAAVRVALGDAAFFGVVARLSKRMAYTFLPRIIRKAKAD